MYRVVFYIISFQYMYALCEMINFYNVNSECVYFMLINKLKFAHKL